MANRRMARPRSQGIPVSEVTRVSCGPVTSVTSRAGPGGGVRGERRWGGHGDISAAGVHWSAVVTADFDDGNAKYDHFGEAEGNRRGDGAV